MDLELSQCIKNRVCFAIFWVPLLVVIMYLEKTRVVLFEVVISGLLLIWVLLLLSRLYLIKFKRSGIILFGLINLIPLMLYFIAMIFGYQGDNYSQD